MPIEYVWLVFVTDEDGCHPVAGVGKTEAATAPVVEHLDRDLDHDVGAVLGPSRDQRHASEEPSRWLSGQRS